MKKEVKLCISGSRFVYVDDELEDESISVLTSGEYEKIDGMHKITYSEVNENDETTNNTILIGKNNMQIKKEGFTKATLDFSKEDKSKEITYSTAFGDIFMRILTHEIDIKEEDNKIIVDVDYSLSLEQSLLSSSKITLDISFKK